MAKYRKKADWQRIFASLEGFDPSEQLRRAREQGVNEKTFYAARARYMNGGAKKQKAAPGKQAAGFRQFVIAEQVREVIVRLPSGIEIRIPDWDKQALRDVVAMWEGAEK